MANAFTEAYRKTEWQAIFSSKLRRAIDTARPLCDALGITLQVRSDLNEIGYGQWEGLTRDEVSRRYHDDYVNWLADPARNAPSGGETARVIAERALSVVEELKTTAGGNVLIVSHKATIRIMLCRLLGIEVGQFRYRLGCPVGSLSMIEFTSNGPMLQTLADRSHLSEELRGLPGT